MFLPVTLAESHLMFQHHLTEQCNWAQYFKFQITEHVTPHNNLWFFIPISG
jgi:hypothetical protein